MPEFDVIIRGATPHGFVGIAAGKFADLLEDGSGSAREEIDARGLTILPGVIDAHVHFNEPGRADWEGLEMGSRACAAGGTTTFFDMPLNAHPPTVNAAAFDEKLALAKVKSVVDFALWGGLVPGNIDALEALRDRGVIGLKAFMSHSGIEDFSNVDLATLRAGMQRAAAIGLPVAVHAEFDRPAFRQGTTIRDYLDSRPIQIEEDAIRAALEIAGETGCALHIVHVSSSAGVALITEARQRGVDVTGETCPHYFTLSEDDVEQIGALAKCAPPIRSKTERAALFTKVLAGEVHTIGSDHSPSPMAMKHDADFFKVWGGIAGCQHLLALSWHAGLSPAQCAALLAGNTARRFRLADRKGCIAVGLDADCVLVDPAGSAEVQTDALEYRHRVTPYAGMRLRGHVERTILRGATVARAGRWVAAPGQGRFVKPTL